MKPFNFQYAPGDATATSTGVNNKKTVKTRVMPQADADLKDVSEAVAESWLANPDITLRYKKSADFKTEVTNFSSSLVSRLKIGSLRPGQTNTLKQLDDQIDNAVNRVKAYIKKKYEEDDQQAQYSRFGIVKENRSYVISGDRNNRLLALQLMIDGIAADGFGNEKFGTVFWTDMQTAYKAAFTQASNTTGEVSSKVGTKNQRKDAIREVLVSLLKVLEGNYPDKKEYKAVIRQWGWRKESY